jgi:hypothetical protein
VLTKNQLAKVPILGDQNAGFGIANLRTSVSGIPERISATNMTS